MAVRRKTTKKKTPARKAPAKRKTAAKKKTATRKAPARKTAAKKKATKKALPDTLTYKHLAAELSEAHELPKKQVEELLSDYVDRIGGYLKKGKKLRIAGLGILQVRHRAARWGRNPATGEKIRIKASKKVAFRVAKDLKERVL
ncbi:HU family DNA-binding protein [Hyphococcus flavus]|uniref:HU family DNA-binding protein n=1 Tax=Hyphococcus flavus TaxID=1866326 RepID=A0AAF0CBT7_9PROT|nr:HU family DNA-binding protein [Hyphococcus flavus]WDI31810.1 HU family DNA-binding protein [Hyphococcus flavus]